MTPTCIPSIVAASPVGALHARRSSTIAARARPRPAASGRAYAALQVELVAVRSLALPGARRAQAPSRASSQEEELSAKALSKMPTSSWRSRACSIGHEHLDAPVEVARHQIGAPEEELDGVADLEGVERGCARGSGRRSSGRGCLAQAGNAGRSMQIERATISIVRARPSRPRRARRSIAWSVSALTLIRMRLPVAVRGGAWPTARIRSTSRVRRPNGATRIFLKRAGAAEAGQVVEERGDVGGDLGIGGEEAESSYERAVSAW